MTTFQCHPLQWVDCHVALVAIRTVQRPGFSRSWCSLWITDCPTDWLLADGQRAGERRGGKRPRYGTLFGFQWSSPICGWRPLRASQLPGHTALLFGRRHVSAFRHDSDLGCVTPANGGTPASETIYVANYDLAWGFSIKAPVKLTASATEKVVQSGDPNDMQAGGFGPQGWIVGNQTIPYTIDFENMPTAAAPAAGRRH